MTRRFFTISKPLIVLLFLFCFAEVVNAQSLTWEKVYSRDGAYGVSRINDSTFYVCGVNGNSGLIMKVNQFGDTLWTRKYTDTKITTANSIITTEDNGCIVAGGYDATFAAKYDQNGSLIWETHYNFGGRIKKIIKGENCFYICGIYPTSGYIFKIDNSGDLIWDKIYSNIQPNDICFDINLNSLIAVSTIYSQNVPFGHVMKLDTAGNTVTQNTFKILRQSTSCTHIDKYKNDFFVAGATFDSNAAFSVSYIVRINSNGDTLYKKIFPTNLQETVQSFHIQNYNKLIFSSEIFSSFIADTSKTKLFTTDTLGNVLQLKSIVKDYYCSINAGTSLGSKYNIFVGYLDSLLERVWIIKTDSLYNLNPVNITNSNSIIKDYYLSQNYPNPFNPSTSIIFTIPKNGISTLKVYNNIGKEVYSSSKYFYMGTNQIQFAPENLASGIYFYSLQFGETINTKKMIFVK